MATQTFRKPSLGLGLYSVPDVALILKLNPTLVRRWLHEYWGSKLNTQANEAVFASWGVGREKAVDFYTLIEFYVFYQLRQKGVSPQSIVKAHQAIAVGSGQKFPFANSTVLTDGRKIFYSLDGESIVNADKTLQLNFKSIIEMFCHKIDFGKNQLALRYWPLGKDRNVVVDPHHQLGQPTIKDTNILAETLYSMYTAGEKTSFISSLYNISENDVKASIDFFRKPAA
jgi:uncharacterized protein (DUF433 family)